MSDKAEGIRIFLRIRPPVTAQHGTLLASSSSSSAAIDNTPCDYRVEHSFSESTVHLHVGRRESGEVVNNSAEDYHFRFRRVFEPQSTQEEVFASVARDSVQSLLDGYNATVFAYGQTGSGKTYSITGGTDSYDDRGIIPRALAMIYDALHAHNTSTGGGDATASTTQWSVDVSYLQIYNDRGQDLLNGGKDAKSLDELPAVTVHEGDDGAVVLRGLRAHTAATLGDALDLLFLGDTNRLYCETPMNRTSSRSHCIFSVTLTARDVGAATVRRSKLHLVDLAGSERVAKAGVGGSILVEAKHINLSLHYLEHVIVALGEQASGTREHVPFRNSFMTMVLRDSLGANCRTTMLATAHLARGMLPETISTCQFAQRVARIRQHAHVNVEADPALLVPRLRAEVAQLRDRLAFYERGGGGDNSSGGGGADRALDADEQHMCARMVDAFVASSDPHARLTGFEGDLARVYYCTELLKRRVREATAAAAAASSRESGGKAMTANGSSSVADATALQTLRADVSALRTALQHKENEVNVLLDMLRQTRGAPRNAATQTGEAAAAAASDDDGSSADASPYDRATVAALARQLRGGGSSATTATTDTTRHDDNNSNDNNVDDKDGASSSSPSTTTQAEAAAAALARVHELSHSGTLSSADAAAARVFLLRRSEARLAAAYNLDALTDANLLRDRAAAFDAFKASYRNYAAVTRCKETLKEKYTQCKTTARELNALVEAIRQTKTRVQRLRAERAADGVVDADADERALLDTLTAQKSAYNTLAHTLRAQKGEIDGMHAFMKRSHEQLARDYEEWLDVRQAQVAMALGDNSGGANVHNKENDNNNSNNSNNSKMAATTMTAPPHVLAATHEPPHPSSAPTPTRLQTASATTVSTSQQQQQPPTRLGGWTSNATAPTQQQQQPAASIAPWSATTTTTSSSNAGTVVADMSALQATRPRLTTSSSLPASVAVVTSNNNSSSSRSATSSSARGVGVLDWNGNGTSNTATAAVTTTTSLSHGVPRRLQPLEPVHATAPSSSSPHNVALYHTTTTAATPASALLLSSAAATSYAAAVPTTTTAVRTVPPLQQNSNNDNTTAAPVPLPRERVNAFAPAHRSTGDSAADEQLAALYRARDAMRAQLQP